MKLFYYCYGRAHSSVVAGNIHLNRLPSDRIPSINEILAVPEFDQSEANDFGIPYFLGKDEQNNEVYIIGFGGAVDLGLQTVYFALDGIANPQDWKFFNALNAVGWLTKIGGFTSKELRFKPLGKYLVALGIQGSYLDLVALVKRVKENNKWPVEK